MSASSQDTPSTNDFNFDFHSGGGQGEGLAVPNPSQSSSSSSPIFSFQHPSIPEGCLSCALQKDINDQAERELKRFRENVSNTQSSVYLQDDVH